MLKMPNFSVKQPIWSVSIILFVVLYSPMNTLFNASSCKPYKFDGNLQFGEPDGKRQEIIYKNCIDLTLPQAIMNDGTEGYDFVFYEHQVVGADRIDLDWIEIQLSKDRLNWQTAFYWGPDNPIKKANSNIALYGANGAKDNQPIPSKDLYGKVFKTGITVDLDRAGLSGAYQYMRIISPKGIRDASEVDAIQTLSSSSTPTPTVLVDNSHTNEYATITPLTSVDIYTPTYTSTTVVETAYPSYTPTEEPEILLEPTNTSVYIPTIDVPISMPPTDVVSFLETPSMIQDLSAQHSNNSKPEASKNESTTIIVTRETYTTVPTVVVPTNTITPTLQPSTTPVPVVPASVTEVDLSTPTATTPTSTSIPTIGATETPSPTIATTVTPEIEEEEEPNISLDRLINSIKQEWKTTKETVIDVLTDWEGAKKRLFILGSTISIAIALGKLLLKAFNAFKK